MGWALEGRRERVAERRGEECGEEKRTERNDRNDQNDLQVTFCMYIL